jgi:hypothetical protein
MDTRLPFRKNTSAPDARASERCATTPVLAAADVTATGPRGGALTVV